MERLRRVLLAQAPLFAEEKAYVAGVEDAIAAVLELGHIVIDLHEGAVPGVHPPEPTVDDREELPPDGGWFG